MVGECLIPFFQLGRQGVVFLETCSSLFILQVLITKSGRSSHISRAKGNVHSTEDKGFFFIIVLVLKEL